MVEKRSRILFSKSSVKCIKLNNVPSNRGVVEAVAVGDLLPVEDPPPGEHPHLPAPGHPAGARVAAVVTNCGQARVHCGADLHELDISVGVNVTLDRVYRMTVVLDDL